jgi:thiamine kinase-like enzyme
MEHIKVLGATMSDMHFLLKTKNDVVLPSVYDEYQNIVEQMSIYFSKAPVRKAIRVKLGVQINSSVFTEFTKLLTRLALATGQQPLHMDFVRGNILFENKKISGILDFEKVAMGHAIMDISRTLAFLLVDCKYKQSEKIEKYFLVSGYQKRGRNKDVVDADVRGNLVKMFLLYDFYKFLRHNPYESLGQNEHYTRTRDILVDKRVISLI